jgi:hypothetical protein
MGENENERNDEPAGMILRRKHHQLESWDLQRIREDMTLRFQKQEVGSWKLEFRFSQLCTGSLCRTKIHESFSLPMNKVD